MYETTPWWKDGHNMTILYPIARQMLHWNLSDETVVDWSEPEPLFGNVKITRAFLFFHSSSIKKMTTFFVAHKQFVRSWEFQLASLTYAQSSAANLDYQYTRPIIVWGAEVHGTSLFFSNSRRYDYFFEYQFKCF